MNKKKLIISVLCMVLLSVMPVQAAVDICTHPVFEYSNKEYHGYDTTEDQHREWWQKVIKICTTCHEEVLDNVVYGAWEDHNWKFLSSESGNSGQTVHDAVCTVCGDKDTVITYP